MIPKIIMIVVTVITSYTVTTTTTDSSLELLKPIEEPAIQTAQATTTETVEVLEPLLNIEQIVRDHFGDVTVMVAIARCESGFRQFNEAGEPLKNPNSSATGIMQLMASYHREPARNLGYDIDTVEGNLGYALVLYKREGVKPWEASFYCWGSADMAINNGILDKTPLSPTPPKA